MDDVGRRGIDDACLIAAALNLYAEDRGFGPTWTPHRTSAADDLPSQPGRIADRVVRIEVGDGYRDGVCSRLEVDGQALRRTQAAGGDLVAVELDRVEVVAVHDEGGCPGRLQGLGKIVNCPVG